MTTETTYTTASGVVYVISDGLSHGKSWGTYQRKPNGALRRVVSKWLPLRSTRKEALDNFDRWIANLMYNRASAAGRDELRPVYEALLGHKSWATANR